MAGLFTLDRICRTTPVLEPDDHANWPTWRSNMELYLTAHNLWRVVSDRGIHPREPIKQDYFRHAKLITAAGASLYGIPNSTTTMEIFEEDRYAADCRPFDEWKARDAHARLLILASASVRLAEELARESSSANMWELVNHKFAGNPVVGLAGGPVANGPVGPIGPVASGSSGGSRGHRRSQGSRASVGNVCPSGSNRNGGGSGGNGDNAGNGGNGETRGDEGNTENPGSENGLAKRRRE